MAFKVVKTLFELKKIKKGCLRLRRESDIRFVIDSGDTYENSQLIILQKEYSKLESSHCESETNALSSLGRDKPGTKKTPLRSLNPLDEDTDTSRFSKIVLPKLNLTARCRKRTSKNYKCNLKLKNKGKKIIIAPEICCKFFSRKGHVETSRIERKVSYRTIHETCNTFDDIKPGKSRRFNFNVTLAKPSGSYECEEQLNLRLLPDFQTKALRE